MSSSKTHTVMKIMLQKFANESKNLTEYTKFLKANDITYEDYELANGRQITVYTGSSGYDIVGVAAKIKNGKIIIEDI